MFQHNIFKASSATEKTSQFMSKEANIPVIWHLHCKYWLETFYLTNKSGASYDDAIDDIYLIIYLTRLFA